MLEFDYQDLEDWSGGEWVNAPPGERVLGFSYDTRRLSARGQLGSKSPKRDGHNFIEEAKRKGDAALVSSPRMAVEMPQLVVKDTLVGLGNLAGVPQGWCGYDNCSNELW